MKKLTSFIYKPGFIYCAAAVAFALVFLCFFGFRMRVDSHIDEDMRFQIEAIEGSKTQLIQNEIKYLKEMTASAALMLGGTEILTDEDILQNLEDYSDTPYIVRAMFLTLDGHAYSSDGGYLGQSRGTASIDGIPLWEITFPTLSKSYYAEDLDEVIFGVLAPAAVGDRPGVLAAYYNISKLAVLLERELIGGTAETGIVKSSGEVVSGKTPDQFNNNIFAAMRNVEFRFSSIENMRTDMAKGVSGFSIYCVNGVTRYCTYAPIGVNDWYTVVTIKESSLRGKLTHLGDYGLRLTVELVVIMSALLLVIIANKLGEQRKIRRILEEAAMLDGLTGIYNRKTSEELIERSLRTAREGACSALLVLDLDDFKEINDQKGHFFGDKVLKRCAGQLESIFGDDGVVGRIGGDEFIVFLWDGRDTPRIEEKVNELIGSLYVLSETGDKEMISISIGIARTGPKADSFAKLYQMADSALYRAKKMGKARLSD